jgi:hypothetical protein
METAQTTTPTKKAKAKAKAAPKEGMGRYREAGVIEDWKKARSKFNFNPKSTVRLLVKENPKQGASKKRFDIYSNGKKVETCMKEGVKKADLCWDITHKFIELVPPAKPAA